MTNQPQENSLTINIAADRYTATVVDQGKTTTIDLAGMKRHKRVRLVGQLWEWKSGGFRGNPPALTLKN